MDQFKLIFLTYVHNVQIIVNARCHLNHARNEMNIYLLLVTSD